MAINVCVQDNGGFLPDIILLTHRYYHLGTRLNAMKDIFILAAYYDPTYKRFGVSPPLTGGCSEGLDALRFSLNKQLLSEEIREVECYRIVSGYSPSRSCTSASVYPPRDTTHALVSNIRTSIRSNFFLPFAGGICGTAFILLIHQRIPPRLVP